MSISFSSFFDRLRKVTDITTQMALAEALGVNRSAVTQAKIRDAVPQKWILNLARRYHISPDWLEFGAGSPREISTSGRSHALNSFSAPGKTGQIPRFSGELCSVPKAAARLCAGGGSYEVDANPVDTFALPRSWLASLGAPEAMVFMDVVGNSMEPGIHDGDMVLIDKSPVRCTSGGILAVGIEDAIYLKRLEQVRDGIRLLSDNPDYAPLELEGDELNSFYIIGKMVWLCREYT